MRFGINLDLQTDFLTADLGYLTNAGFTFRRGLNLIEDDRLGVEVAVRISDHLENVDGTIQVVLIVDCSAMFHQTSFQVVSLAVHTGDQAVSVTGREVMASQI